MDANFNIKLYQLLSDWNPMQFDDTTLGDAEYYEVMDIVHQKLSREETIARIQGVFQYSFQTTIEQSQIETLLNKIEILNQTCQCSEPKKLNFLLSYFH
ncbi:DUF1871 family protein [Macrococcus sp. DPC7161]|uniref:DUF1871 family protein n=1 Tax=Macrococcus sp. DPC7161 TaxID=2507060 RepID=UPI00197B6F78|nr:DUF1871 family protein [Macrococcus sp. DPC7161]